MTLEVIISAVIVETVTIGSRMVYGPVDRYTRKLTFGIHIHHGYIGIILGLLGWIFAWYWALVVGLALFLSDLFHYFITPPLWVGRREL